MGKRWDSGVLQWVVALAVFGVSAAGAGAQEIVSIAADLNLTPRGSSPQFLTVYNGALYFQAQGRFGDSELWRYDGTNATQVTDIVPGSGGSAPQASAVLQQRALFYSDRHDERPGVVAIQWFDRLNRN